MRRGELVGLRWSNIDFENSKIKIEEQATVAGIEQILKTTNSYRTISVDPKVLEVLKEIKGDDKYVFMCGYGGISSLLSMITVTVRRCFDKAGMSKVITLHSLRHFHATQLIKEKMNVKIISKRLGHSNIQITLDTYVHWLPTMNEEASLVVGKNFIIG